MRTKRFVGGALVGGALIAVTSAPVGAAASTDRVVEANIRDGYSAVPFGERHELVPRGHQGRAAARSTQTKSFRRTDRDSATGAAGAH